METGTHYKAGRIIDVPLKLRRLLLECDTLKQAIEACTTLHTVLEATRELWFVADYSYKARELCRAGWHLIDSLNTPNTHHTLVKKSGPIREALRRLEFDFHSDECDRLGFPKA